MNIRSLRGSALLVLGQVQETMGRHAGRHDWRLAGLLRQVRARLYLAQLQRERAVPWRAARP